MFCNKSLGENRVVEHFPVGRRLAFDAEKGRLWVVCRKCERWDLSPLEERWEALEACERIFRETRLRVSTEHVGLARHAEGLELIRIGRPLRPEFAAWRYGDQFGRRRTRALVYTGGGLALLAGATFLSPAIAGGSGMGGYWIWQIWEGIRASRNQAKLPTDDGRVLKLTQDHFSTVRLRPDGTGDGFRLSVFKGRKQEWFDGPQAERFASIIIPKMNHMGGKKRTVESAVREIEQHGHPDGFLADVVSGDRFQGRKGEPGFVSKMPGPTRLALEMALHEEEERRALEGELWRLERAWEAAEEIAAISDDLLLPGDTADFIAEHRDGAESKDDPTGS